MKQTKNKNDISISLSVHVSFFFFELYSNLYFRIMSKNYSRLITFEFNLIILSIYICRVAFYNNHDNKLLSKKRRMT